ncbi:MAG: hypothetical protein GWN87_15095, partial [Desulfuromonadales bacterium]|nr:hypothetical protein [Desulfuromonadales bacterium]
MRPVRTLISLLGLLLGVGCAGYDPEYDPLERWIGMTERDLVMAGGAPDTVHEMSNGNRVLTWRYENVEQHGGEL